MDTFQGVCLSATLFPLLNSSVNAETSFFQRLNLLVKRMLEPHMFPRFDLIDDVGPVLDILNNTTHKFSFHLAQERIVKVA